MSAVNVLRQTSAVHVITDGAAYSGAGAFDFGMPKVWPLPHINAVVACRGPTLFPAIVASVIAAIGDSYDGVKTRAADELRAGMALLGAVADKGPHGSDFDAIIAGWSERDGPDAYLICNHDGYPGIAPWSLVQFSDVNLLPGDAALLEAFPPGTKADDVDPVRDGLRILEIQRRQPITMRSGQTALVVGAFAQLTTIGRDMITTRVLHRWPDVIGEKIGGC